MREDTSGRVIDEETETPRHEAVMPLRDTGPVDSRSRVVLSDNIHFIVALKRTWHQVLDDR